MLPSEFELPLQKKISTVLCWSRFRPVRKTNPMLRFHGEWVSIRGIVRGIENLPTPLAQPFLSIAGQPTLRFTASLVRPDGAFEFQKVLPTTYTISLRAQDSDGSRPMLQSKSVTVSKESSPTVVFEVPPTVLIHGRIALD